MPIARLTNPLLNPALIPLLALAASRPCIAQCESDEADPAQAGSRDQCGAAIAISTDGARAILGAPLHDFVAAPAGVDCGAAFVYSVSAATLTQPVLLSALDRSPDDRFGSAVAIDAAAAFALIGAPFDNNQNGVDAGSAYVFSRAGALWTQQAKLVAPDGAASDSFAAAAAIDPAGAWAALGSPRDDTESGVNAGSVWLFHRIGATWTAVQRLEAPDGAPADRFGASLAMDDARLIVGALLDDDHGAESGAAYIFALDGAGTTWAFESKLTPADGAPADQFGQSVAISGDTALIGAWLDDDHGADAGSAYAFSLAGGAWIESQKITDDRQQPNDLFGISVSLAGDDAAIGAKWTDRAATPTQSLANAGAAYSLHREPGAPWAIVRRCQAVLGTTDDELGAAVAIAAPQGSGAALLFGAPGRDHAAGADAGAAYLFRVNGPDCNTNDLCDRREIALGRACDTNSNTVPDDCEPFPIGNPVITAQPSHVEADGGADASFTVSATGTGLLRYRWRRNGLELSDGGRYSGTGTASLSIQSVSCADAGQFSVTISDRCDESVSEPADLTVLDPAPSISPDLITVPDGEDAILTVSSAGDRADWTFAWRREGVPVVDAERISGASTRSLTIHHARCGDAGNYSAVVNDGCGDHESNPAQLYIAGAADWNGTGGVDSQDYFDFLGGFFESAGDFTGDGATDSQDFFEFLDAFFVGC